MNIMDEMDFVDEVEGRKSRVQRSCTPYAMVTTGGLTELAAGGAGLWGLWGLWDKRGESNQKSDSIRLRSPEANYDATRN
jgi:hypothetical protein